MTLRELIAKLQSFPDEAMDYPVLYRRFSDVDLLDDDEILVYAAESKQVVFRGDMYRMAYWGDAYPAGESPNYVAAVVFPGN